MKQIKKTPFYLLLLLSLNACSKEFPCSTMEDHFMAYSYKPNAIKKSNIKSRNRIDFSKGEQDIYVISPNIPSKKVDRIEYFNDDGYLILVVEPIYKMGKTDTTGYSNLPYLEQLVFVQEVETNAPTGQVDSIIFSYNSKNIIKRFICFKFKTICNGE